MIKLTNLKKYYNAGKSNEVKAVDDVSLSFEGNGLFVILGKSGCGKSTLLNVIAGLDNATGGSITHDGNDYSRYKSKKWDAFRNKNIGFIYQNYNLVGNISVFRNLEIALNVAGLDDDEEIAKRIDYALKLVGMENFRSRQARSLSGGQQQRVGIARAIVTGSRIIVADEPTGNLDRENSIAVMDILRSLATQRTVLLVTHEDDLAYHYGDRIICYSDGKVVSDKPNEAGEHSLGGKHKIYLDELSHETHKINDKIALDVYDDGSDHKLKLTVVFSKGRIIVRDDRPDTNADIELVETKQPVLNDVKVDLGLLSPIEGEYKSIFNIKSVLAESRLIKKKGKKRRMRRLHLRVLFFISLAFVLSTSAFASAVFFNPFTDMAYPKDSVVVLLGSRQSSNELAEALTEHTNLSSEDMYTHQCEQQLRLRLMLRNDQYIFDNATVIPYSVLGKGDLDENEVVLGGLLAKRLERFALKDNGIVDIDYIEGETIMVGDLAAFLTIKAIEENNEPLLYVSNRFYASLPLRSDNTVIVYTSKPASIAKTLKSLGYNAMSGESYSRHLAWKEIRLDAMSHITGELVVTLLLALCIVGVVSNAFVPKMKLVTVLRSVGVTKRDFDKYSILYNLSEVLFSLVLGFVVGSLIVGYQAASGRIFSSGAYYPWWLAIIILAIEVGIYLVVNLVGIRFYLRRTPSALLSKYDL